MSKYISEEHHKAVDLMSRAREILFSQLHGQLEARKVLAEGLDRLGLAFEYVENPLGVVTICPNCEGFCLEKTLDGKNQCLNCDHVWSECSGGRHAEH